MLVFPSSGYPWLQAVASRHELSRTGLWRWTFVHRVSTSTKTHLHITSTLLLQPLLHESSGSHVHWTAVVLFCFVEVLTLNISDHFVFSWGGGLPIGICARHCSLQRGGKYYGQMAWCIPVCWIFSTQVGWHLFNICISCRIFRPEKSLKGIKSWFTTVIHHNHVTLES